MVINPLSLVKSLVFVGRDAVVAYPLNADEVINPLSLVNWLVFVGKSAEVINPLSLVNEESAVGVSEIKL